MRELNEYEKKYQIALTLIEGVNHLFYVDKHYPNRLKQCEYAPLNLYYKVNVDWNNDKFISIVGTRKASSFGKQFTNELVKE